MIVYDSRSWCGSLFHVRGTVIPHIWIPTTFIAFWCAGVYHAQLRWPEHLVGFEIEGSFVLFGHFVSFLLIFRSNNAYQRYWHSNDCLKAIQVSCRELHQQYMIYIKGALKGKDDEQKAKWKVKGTRCKTDATRYVLAFCIAFKMHSRMAFDGYMSGSIDNDTMEQVLMDRARLRGVLVEEEFEVIDSMLRVDLEGITKCADTTFAVSTEVNGRACHAILYFLLCLGRDAAMFAQQWGWLERCLNTADAHVSNMMRAFEEMDQNICTPLPLPYGHLCKILLLTFMLAFPFCINKPMNGLVISVIVPMVISLAMFGMESISMEIEDPFGDDANDFNVMRIISALESNMYETMLCRCDPAADNFMWVKAPEDYADCTQFLCLVSAQDALLEMLPACKLTPYKPLAFPDYQPKAARRRDPFSQHDRGPQTHEHLSGPRLWRQGSWSWD